MKPKTIKMGASSVEQIIGIRLRKLRLERNLTLPDMDKRIGVTTGTTKAMEDGKRFLATGHILALGKALKVDISLLFPEPGEIAEKTGKPGPRPRYCQRSAAFAQSILQH